MKVGMSSSKLRAEIRGVQAQLKSAIQSHQMIVFKLKDRPVSIKLRVQMCNVQRHIVSLGEQQKKLLSQLRQELEVNGTSIPTDQKPCIKALEKLRSSPSNTVTPPSPVNVKKEPVELIDSDGVASHVKREALAHSSKRKSKLVATKDIQDIPLSNGQNDGSSICSSQKENTPASTPSSSPPPVGSTNNSQKQRTLKQEPMPASSTSDESQDAYIHLPPDPELRKKLQFMTALCLVTREVLTEVQNRRTERKRRSTTNPLFLNGCNADQKLKKTVYLSSGAVGVVPLVNTVNNLLEHEKSEPFLKCLSCSKSDGLYVLRLCYNCNRAFHWNCLFDPRAEIPSGEDLKCRDCLQKIPSSVTKTVDHN